MAGKPGARDSHAMRTIPDTVIIRRAGDSDGASLRRLSELDGGPCPGGDVLLAEVDGEARVALGLGDSRVVADPFSPTEDLVELLRTRAERLRDSHRHSHARSGHHLVPRRLARTMRRGDLRRS